MTNFAFLMDLFCLSPKFFLTDGFDHTLVSRWRSGKRRLMPGRRQVCAIAARFWELDAQAAKPTLEKLLGIWYPLLPRTSAAHKQEHLERFLTEKGQLNPAYQKAREARLAFLRERDPDALAAPRGMDAVRLGLLDFFSLALETSEPQPLYLVFTEGNYPYFDDPEFSRALQEKMTQAFEAGRRLAIAARSDRAMSDSWDLSRIMNRFCAHLKGYIRTQLYDDFRPQSSEKILGLAGERFAFRVTREAMWDFAHSYINFYHDPAAVAEVRAQVEGYFARAQPVVCYDFFNRPAGCLEAVRIKKEQPCYLFTRLPHFGLAPLPVMAEQFALSNPEQLRLDREFQPLTLPPQYFDEDVRVRHLFCATEIERALRKKRHQAHELSAMLQRKVWMPTAKLVRQLQTIQTLLKTRRNYEVCFLDEAFFPPDRPQLCQWGDEATLAWIADHPALVSVHQTTSAVTKNFCDAVWEDIPAAARSHTRANRKLNQWLRKVTRDNPVAEWTRE